MRVFRFKFQLLLKVLCLSIHTRFYLHFQLLRYEAQIKITRQVPYTLDIPGNVCRGIFRIFFPGNSNILGLIKIIT